MALRFTIENFPNLPDGGPTTFSVTGKRSVDIGRDQHLDWTLPDPTRFVSGKHCEVHYKNGAYWLHDISTNGTFLNGSDQRMRSPHQLKNGDKLFIGQYIVGVELDSGARSLSDATSGGASGLISQQHTPYPALWDDNDAPPPVDRQYLKMARDAARPVNPDFLDWAARVPEVDSSTARRRSTVNPPQPTADMDWASGPVSAPPFAPQSVPPLVAPQRPVWKDPAVLSADASPFLASRPVGPIDPPSLRPEVHLDPPDPPVMQTLAAKPHRENEADEFLHRLARAANLPADFFAGKDPNQVADQIGEVVRISVGSLMTLLQARNEAKRFTRSTNQTTIEATENNPLKFSPTAEDAMRTLFGPKTQSYLDARRAIAQGFDDLKSHQLKTYMAMQHAVAMLAADLDPNAITKGIEADEGFIDRVRSRKSRLWDAFVIRWKASFGRDRDGVVEAFMLHFANYYDREDRIDSR